MTTALIRRTLGATLLAALVLGAVAAPAFAGKAGGATTTSVKLAIPNGVFAGTTTATVTGASGYWVHIACTVNGTTALTATQRTDATGRTTFTLGPTATWTSGGASCSGDTGYYNSRGKYVVVTTTSFTVSAS